MLLHTCTGRVPVPCAAAAQLLIRNNAAAWLIAASAAVWHAIEHMHTVCNADTCLLQNLDPNHSMHRFSYSTRTQHSILNC